MALINVQFSDSTKSTVIAYFADLQQSVGYPNSGAVDTDSAAWATFYNDLPASMQSALPAPTSSG